MSSITAPIGLSVPFARSAAIAALLSATMLASPLSAARADTVTNGAFQLAQAASPAGAGATQTQGETVEQRITNLHTALKITAAEEAKWNNVAQAMRENAAAMGKLVAETRTTPPQSMTAVEDFMSGHRPLAFRPGAGLCANLC